MKSGIVSVILLVVALVSLHGQVNRFGVPLHSSYSLEPTGASEYNHCMTKDNNGVVYFGNDGRGIIRYDGANWTLIPVDGQPVLYAITSGKDNVIYAGGTYEFGYLSPGIDGEMAYTSLAHRLDSTINIGNVMSILALDDRIIFTATRNIFFYYPDKDSIVQYDGAANGYRNMWRMANLNGRIIVSDNVHGLFEIVGDTLSRIAGSEYYRRKVCRVMLPAEGNNLIIGTPSHGLSLFDIVTGEVTEDFVDSDINERLIEAQIYTGTKVGDKGFAIGTLYLEGVLVFNNNAELIYKFTKETIGTDDNLVTAVYSSSTRPEELWICTIGTATKVHTGLPFTQFSNSQGITSGVNAIVEFNNTVYISHDNGVSKLIEPDGSFSFFEKLPIPEKTTYPLTLFKLGSEEFLIAGSQTGGYLIDRRNNAKNFGEVTLDIEKSRIAAIGGSQAISSIDVRSVVQSKSEPRNLYLGINSYLLVLRYEGNNRWRYVSETKRFEGFVNMVFEDSTGRVWLSTDVSNSLYTISVVNGDSIYAEYNTSNGLPERSGIKVRQLNGYVVTITPKGVYRLNEEEGKFEDYNSYFNDFSKDREISLLKADADGDLWMSIRKGTERFLEAYLPAGKSASDYITLPFGVLPNAPSYDIESIRGREWMAKSKNIFVVDKEALINMDEAIKPYLNRIVLGADSVYMNQSFFSTNESGRRSPSMSYNGLKAPEFSYSLNDVSFYWTTNYYVDEEKTQYRFFLKGNDKEWSKWDNVLYKDFNNLRFGHYQFRLQARSVTGLVSEETVFEFTILKPWYARFIAIVFYILAVVGIILIIIKAYTKRLIRENLRLEGIVAERTAEVVKQKDELESSIHYASRIQMALLPSEKILSENIKNYFVLFKPRDIVSGDFYWMTKRNDKLFIVAADCTGHGVPGAFMSLLGMSFLDEIVNKSSIQRADLILKELRIHVTNSLKQVGEEDEAKDGMDMALLMIDFTAGKVEFSGAYNPCFKIRKLTDSEIESYTEENYDSQEGVMSNGRYLLETVFASKMPIGISSRMKEDFLLHQWDMEKGVSYYLFSDGYVDQFGSNGRKFMKKNFKKLLLDIQEYPMEKQKDILEETLRQWMGDTPQIDDILVMGLRTD